MSRVLTTPHLATGERHLASPGWHADASTQALIDRLEADAYRRGHADGEEAATTRAVAAAERASATVRPLLDQLVAGLGRLRDERVRADVELALSIAELVLGTVPVVTVDELTARVQAAVDGLADPDLEVRVHPDHAEVLRARVADHGGRQIRVVADPETGAAEAHVAGRWGRAEVTREAALVAVREALTGEGTADA